MQFFGGFKLCCTSRKVFAIVHKGDFSACFKRLLDWSLFVLWSLVQAIFTLCIRNLLQRQEALRKRPVAPEMPTEPGSRGYICQGGAQRGGTASIQRVEAGIIQ